MTLAQRMLLMSMMIGTGPRSVSESGTIDSAEQSFIRNDISTADRSLNQVTRFSQQNEVSSFGRETETPRLRRGR